MRLRSHTRDAGAPVTARTQARSCPTAPAFGAKRKAAKEENEESAPRRKRAKTTVRFTTAQAPASNHPVVDRGREESKAEGKGNKGTEGAVVNESIPPLRRSRRLNVTMQRS